MISGKERGLLSFPARPVFSPDGRAIAYTVNSGIYLIPSAGGESELLRKSTGNSGAAAYSWTPDSKKIFYWYGNPIRFALLDPVTRQSSDLLSHSTMEIHSVELYPDQRWIVFTVPAGRKRPLWITPYRDGNAGAESE